MGLTGDAIDLEIDDDGRLVQLKPALGGNVVAPILSRTLPNLVTLRPGLLSPAAPDAGATAAVEVLAGGDGVGGLREVRLIGETLAEDREGLALARARVVLGLGMGAGEGNVGRLRDLARSVGAAVATTRMWFMRVGCRNSCRWGSAGGRLRLQCILRWGYGGRLIIRSGCSGRGLLWR